MCSSRDEGLIRSETSLSLNGKRLDTQGLSNVSRCAAVDRRIQRIKQTLQHKNASRLTTRDLAASINLSVSRTQHLFNVLILAVPALGGIVSLKRQKELHLR